MKKTQKPSTVLIPVFRILSGFLKTARFNVPGLRVRFRSVRARHERFCGESVLEPKRIGRSGKLRSNASFHNAFPASFTGQSPCSRRPTFRVRLNDGFVFTVSSDRVVDPFVVCATLALHTFRRDWTDTAFESHGPRS